MPTGIHEYDGGGVRSRGYLALPGGTGNAPGVLVVHEAPGLDAHPKRRADMLAKLGYVALAADLYGGGVVGEGPQEAFKLMGPLRDNPDLLRRVMALGVTVDAAPAFFLAPLVQVAWAEGTVIEQERDTVLRLARARGVEVNAPAYAQLCAWLRERPGDALFDTAVEVITYGFAVLPPEKQEERIKRVVQACHEVATASGGGLAKVLGLGSGVSSAEASILATMLASSNASASR